MKIFIKAKPNSKLEKVKKIDETHFDVSIKESPRDGKANEAIIKALAKYFDIASFRISIVSGRASKQKTIEIQAASKS